MADLFLSYARRDHARAAEIAAAAEADGRSLWWDRARGNSGDHAAEIEREIAGADRVVVAWSAAARDSLWVRAVANEAQDQEKIVQLVLDGARPPAAFADMDQIDFRDWDGSRDAAPWRELGAALGARQAPLPMLGGRETPLQGFGRIAAIGWTALGIAMIVALSVLLVARRLITAETFGWISVGAALSSTLLLAAAAWILVKVSSASRQ